MGERCNHMACAKAMVEAELQHKAAEFEEAGQKCRRSECKAAISSARASLRPANAAEKVASADRSALLNHYSKAEAGQIKQELEASAISVKEAVLAVKALKAEEYDANQVEEAYQAKKKQKIP